ncbi:MAG: DUF2079 domain-containing protein [Nitrospiraceae bacterium]|nr:DUF2079 domain-containing protein [Nitrospiraceae bacterium]
MLLKGAYAGRLHLAVLAFALLYAATLASLSLRQHHAFLTQMCDLGNADQAVWSAANNDWEMPQTNTADGVPRSRLAVHFNLIFLPVSLLYRLFPRPESLILLNTIACVLAGLGLYAFARNRLGGSAWALVAPLAFWASPVVHDANLFDFHEITITTALIVWMAWAFDTGRRRAGWVLLVLALACKEDVPLVTFMYGVYLFLSGRENRRTGAAICILSISWFVLLLSIVPLISGGMTLEKLGAGERFGWLGNGPADILKNILLSPDRVLRHIFRPDHIRIALYLMLAGGIAAIRQWRMLLLIIPPLAVALLSYDSWMTRITSTYYWITSEAVIIMACVLACGRAGTGPVRGRGPLLYLGLATLIASIVLTPLPYGVFASAADFPSVSETADITVIKDLLPPDAPLSVQNNLGPHFSQRPEVAYFPVNEKKADYVLLHLRYLGGPDAGFSAHTDPQMLFALSPPRLYESAKRLLTSPQWCLEYQNDGFYLFRRSARAAAGGAEAKKIAHLERDYLVLLNQCQRGAGRSTLANLATGDVKSWGHAIGKMMERLRRPAVSGRFEQPQADLRAPDRSR